MPSPYIFISHRWDYYQDYDNLVSRFRQYGFSYSDFSVPHYNPLDVNRKNQIKLALYEQIRRSNFIIIFANMAIANSEWCKYEIEVAKSFNKPILSVKPSRYIGNIPLFIQLADTEGGPSGFNTPAIIRRICNRLGHPIPIGL